MTEQTTWTEQDEKDASDTFSLAHDALDRMRRACKRGTGCHLTADMISALEVTVVGSLWNDAHGEAKDKS